MKRQHPTDPNRIRNDKGQYEKGSLPDRISQCHKCGKTFVQKRILRVQKYCSIECAHTALQERTLHQCANCGKDIFIKPYQLNRKKYCSKKCQHEGRILQKGDFRVCKICGQGYDINEFVKVKDRQSGRGYICRHCACSYQKARYARGIVYVKKGRFILSEYERGEHRKRSIRKYNSKPEIVIKIREYSNRKKREWTENLHDLYIKACLYQAYNVKSSEATPETIELKRQQIMAKRTLKKLKEWRAKHESDRNVISGEQREDETVNEVNRGCEETGHGCDCSVSAGM